MTTAPAARTLRPVEVCRELILALEASEGRRRRRKRDTTPDAIGLKIKRELLEAVIAEDPEPDEFEAWLLERSLSVGPGSGGVRAMALSIWDEWRLALAAPSFRAWLESGAPSDDRATDDGPATAATRPSGETRTGTNRGER